MKQVHFVCFLFLLFLNISSAQKNNKTGYNDLTNISYRIVANENVLGGRWNNKIVYRENNNNTQIKSPSFSSTFTYAGCSTIYDYISNGVPQNFIQDPNWLSNLHIVCTYAPLGSGPSFSNMRSNYYYSSNYGSNWYYCSYVGNYKSFYPSITVYSGGEAVIATQITGSGNLQTVRCYEDIVPITGAFYEYQIPDLGIAYSSPKLVSTINSSLSNKFVLVASKDTTSADSCAWGTFGPSSFSQWQSFNSSKACAYSIAKGGDGRIGIVYKISENSPNNRGSVYFMESVNNGGGFGTPVKIYNANISSTGDSLGMMRGISMAYQGNVPKVVFEVIKRDNNGNYFPNSKKNKIMFWSSSLPGADPDRCIKIADSTNVPFRPYVNTGTTADLFASYCRPTIGSSLNGEMLFTAFMAPSGFTGGAVNTVSFMNIWLTYSTDYGLTWSTPGIINPGSPIKDWTFPCISPLNYNTSLNNYTVNMSVLSDSVPGSYVHNPANGESLAKYFYCKITIALGSIPIAPTLIAPANGTLNVSTTPVFNFQSAYANSYNIQVSTSNSFSVNQIDTNISNTQFIPGNGILTILSQYFWRVRATNNYGTGPWSSVWSFTTGTTSMENSTKGIPAEFKLFDNFPNPFNPETKIRFDIPKYSVVKIVIYDLSGKECETLLNQKLEPGRFQINWNAKNYPSGVYFYKIKAGYFLSVKKCVLIK